MSAFPNRIHMQTTNTRSPHSVIHLSRIVRKRIFRYVRPVKIQISLRIRAGWFENSLGAFWIGKDAKYLHAVHWTHMYVFWPCGSCFAKVFHFMEPVTTSYAIFLISFPHKCPKSSSHVKIIKRQRRMLDATFQINTYKFEEESYLMCIIIIFFFFFFLFCF